MLTATEIAGFVGAGLAGAAYVPQIFHLVRAHCSAGISRLAFRVWLLSSVLTTTRAVAIGAGVFIALGAVQTVATALIMLCAARYEDTLCPSHLPEQPAAKTAAGTGTHVRWPAARAPLPLETSLPGVFAAGDVRRGSVKRVASAVGEGAATIPLVHRYLARVAAGRKIPHRLAPPPAIPGRSPGRAAHSLRSLRPRSLNCASAGTGRLARWRETST